MSYSGYTEWLCANGHYSAADVYAPTPAKCGRCAAKFAWRHSVDQTNGYDESEPYSCSAGTDLIAVDDDWQNDHHGNRYAVQVQRFAPSAGSAWQKINQGETS